MISNTDCKYRTAATLSTPRNVVCFGYISVNTLYKGGNKDDDVNNDNNYYALGDMVSQWHNAKNSSYPVKYVFIMRYVKSHKRFGKEICFLLQVKG